jgi:DNA-binding winged helix-turn-helix (wHTH) protein
VGRSRARCPAFVRSGAPLVDSHRFAEFEIQPHSRRVLRAGAPLPLGARAFDLLLVLIEHRDRVVGKDDLLAQA